jgi:uncharacterized protein GlcG (DUF336 family)
MLTIHRIDQADAQLLLAGARKRAGEIGVPMCIAITDESGQLVAFERMDGGKTTQRDHRHRQGLHRRRRQARDA